MDAHYVANISYIALNNVNKTNFHKFIGEGLIRSILNSGDGKTQKTAFKVIAVSEQSVVLGFLGLKKLKASLMSGKTFLEKYDRVDVVDKQSKRTTVYFDVSTPFLWKLSQK